MVLKSGNNMFYEHTGPITMTHACRNSASILDSIGLQISSKKTTTIV